jgi:hypothetical protein
MAEFENREKRPRGAPSGAQDENSALAEHSRFVDAQKNRGEQGRERRGRPSAEIRHERSNPADRAGSQARKRYVDDDSGPIDAGSARAKGFRNENAWSEPQEEALDRRPVYIDYGAATRRRLLYFTALIIVIGFAGLAASSVSWRKLSNPTETALIGRGAEPQPEEMTDADRPAQNASIVGAQPADVPSDDSGALSAPVEIPASAASIASPETTPATPPTREPAGAKHDDPGYVLAPIEEVAAKPKLLFDQAPPLNLDSSSEPSTGGKVEKAGDIQNASDDENVSRVEKEPKSRVNESISNCLVKVDGRVLINRSCQVSWTKQQQVTFALAEKPLTISHDHGRTWLATLGSRELGKVFKTGSCWGSKRAYICEHHK